MTFRHTIERKHLKYSNEFCVNQFFGDYTDSKNNNNSNSRNNGSAGS